MGVVLKNFSCPPHFLRAGAASAYQIFCTSLIRAVQNYHVGLNATGLSLRGQIMIKLISTKISRLMDPFTCPKRSLNLVRFEEENESSIPVLSINTFSCRIVAKICSGSQNSSWRDYFPLFSTTLLLVSYVMLLQFLHRQY